MIAKKKKVKNIRVKQNLGNGILVLLVSISKKKENPNYMANAARRD